MTIALERPVDSSDQDHRHLLVRVPMRVAHVASLVDQHVIQNGAVAIGNVPELVAEIRQVLHVIPVDLGVVGDVLRLVSVVRRSMPPSGEAGFGEAGTGEVAA